MKLESKLIFKEVKVKNLSDNYYYAIFESVKHFIGQGCYIEIFSLKSILAKNGRLMY